MIWLGIAMIGACGIALEDFKWRMVHIWWYLVLALGLIGLSIVSKGIIDTLYSAVWNTVFVLSILLILTIYLSLKERKFVFPFDRYLGWGDVLFFVALVFYFNLSSYVVFMILSLTAALILSPLIFRWQGKERHIPLAGIQAICLLAYLPISYFKLFQFPTMIAGKL